MTWMFEIVFKNEREEIQNADPAENRLPDSNENSYT